MIPEKFKILIVEGFFSRFDELRRENPDKKMVEVYNMVEDEFYALVGKNRFTGYNSFRNSRKHHVITINSQKRTKTA